MDKRGNIFSRNMRLFAAIMTLIEALVLTSFTGCAGKKVDYGVDTEVKEQKNASNRFVFFPKKLPVLDGKEIV